MMTDAERDADLLKLARAEAWKEGFDAGVKAAEVIPGSPQLDEPTRSAERAAVERAAQRLKRIHARAQGDGSRVFDDCLHDLDWIVAEARLGLADIAALVPDAVPGEAVEREGR